MILTPGGRGARGPADGAGTAGAGQFRCPRCQTPYTPQIINIVDVRRHPQLKAALLSGQLNLSACPNCGAVLALNVPLVYHDPDKEILLVLVPSELNLAPDQQQRLIGGLVQALITHVPPEERKGYFLRPQTILSRQRLIEQILEADGVTREMLEAQARRFRLLEDLLKAMADPARLQSLVQEHRAQLDYSFFATLTSTAQEAEMSGDQQAAQQLLALRGQLLQDPELAAHLPQPLPPDSTVETAVDRLLTYLDDPEALAAMVVVNRPVLNYEFFQGLTAMLEQAQAAGDTARAERLATLRARLLEQIEEQDKAVQAAQQESLRLLDEILSSPEPQATIRQNLDRIDTFFLSILGIALENARREGNVDLSARLDTVRRSILAVMAEGMPPELQLINRLLSLDKAEERQAVLAESAPLVTDELVQMVEQLIQELGRQGRDETVERLRAILAQIQQARAASALQR